MYTSNTEYICAAVSKTLDQQNRSQLTRHSTIFSSKFTLETMASYARSGVKLLKQSCFVMDMKVAHQSSAALVADKKYQADLDAIQQVQ